MTIDFPLINNSVKEHLLKCIVNWNIKGNELSLVFREDLKLIKIFNTYKNDILFPSVILENNICKNVRIKGEDFLIKNGYIFLQCNFDRSEIW